jgi:hypothetical protein
VGAWWRLSPETVKLGDNIIFVGQNSVLILNKNVPPYEIYSRRILGSPARFLPLDTGIVKDS